MKQMIVIAALLTAACSSNLTGPTTIQAPKVTNIPIGFDINIPDIAVVQRMKLTYPQGITISPIEAQRKWDYTAAYGGTPNVYAGTVSPHCTPYVMTGIVIAPLAAASALNPTPGQWSVLEAGQTYEWVGNFVYTRIAQPGTYFTCHY